MANPSNHRTQRFGWSILGYGLALGLLLIVLQMARYRFLLLDHALELYVGLIALLFTVVGIWAGRRLSGKAATAAAESPGPAAPLSDREREELIGRLQITPRELEVLHLIEQGLSNQEIAGRLYVSLNTVKTHIANLFGKLDVQRRTQAVQKARDLGLLLPARPKG